MIDAKTIGEKLAAARSDGEYIDVDLNALPGWEEVDAVRQAAEQAYGDRKVGYKAGATNPAGWEAVNIDRSFHALLFAKDQYEDGAVLPWSKHFRGVEAEYAFTMAGAFDPDTGTAEDLLNAIESCHPALEIVGRRTSGNGMAKFPSLVADFGAQCGFVIGAPIADWRSMDLAAIGVQGLVDGNVKAEGSGAVVLGHPLKSVAWLAQAIRAEGNQLQAGDVVMSGTTIGIVSPTPGANVVGDFGPAGTVSVTFNRS